MEEDGTTSGRKPQSPYWVSAGGRCRQCNSRDGSRVQCASREGPSRRAGEGQAVNAFRTGVDIGGTFTDIVLLGEDGSRYTKKVSSTVDDYARAIVDGLAALLQEIGGEAAGIAELLHGTTVASN